MRRSQNTKTNTSTSEDDLLNLLNLPEHAQTWTRFDKKAKRKPVDVVARITIDDKTGHIMSLEYTKHMTVKDVHRNLPSVRDIRTLLLEWAMCRHRDKKGHKWADFRKRLAEAKDKKVHAVYGAPSTATVAAVEDTEVIDEAGI